MTTTPIPMPGSDAECGVDAAATRFIAGIDAVNAPVIAEVVDAVDGRSGMLLESLTPGPALAALLAELDPSLLTPSEQVSFLLATERLTAWVGSLQNTALVAFTGPAPTATHYTVDGRTQVLIDARRTEIGRHLLWSEGVARGRVATARALACDLPATREALACGALSLARATVIAEGAQNLTSGVDTLLDHAKDGVERVELAALRRDLLDAYETRVTPYAASHDSGRTRSQVNRTIARLDPAGWAARRQRAIREHSNLTLRHLPDGLSELTAVMATEHALTCAQAIEARARQLQTTDPTTRIGLHRTTAMQQLLTQGGAAVANVDSTPATAPSNDTVPVGAEVNPRLQLNVTIDLPTLLALRDGVGEITGAGPIPASVVRELVDAGGAAIRWLTTNDTGQLTGASPGYRIPEALRALIIARDRTCAMPNCTTPASTCEIDHVQPWESGGATSAPNLQALCKRHHQTKTHATSARRTTLPSADARSAIPATRHIEIESGESGTGLSLALPRTPLTGHSLEDFAPLHARLAELHQQLEELTEIGFTNTHLDTAIADLDTQAMRLFDDTLDARFADALPHVRSEGAITVMLRHRLTGHHDRTCRADRGDRAGTSQRNIHSMHHCPNLTHEADTPPF